MSRKVAALEKNQRSTLASLVISYYGAKTRATLALVLSSLRLPVPDKLAKAINPTTSYRLNLDTDAWPTAKQWSIE